MDAGDFNFGMEEDRDPHLDSSSDDELSQNPVAPQGMDSVGEEAASNIIGGGTGSLGSTSTPTDSTLANSGPSCSKRSRCTLWGNILDISLEVNIKTKLVVDLIVVILLFKRKNETWTDQSFTFGDDSRFEYFFQNCLNPSFAKISRNSTRSDTKKAHREVIKDLISELASHGAMGFTSDMWSGHYSRVISLTAIPLILQFSSPGDLVSHCPDKEVSLVSLMVNALGVAAPVCPTEHLLVLSAAI
ncbi:hypothetical protein RHSIM_Rhsim05G0116400 [Rhododendron simsii]|uniref:Uncharacterized protein n=1 Tax=Rhododendron simsii TaxID=118357 RepID=A0A834H6F8_RHOSS|nr:hypothetical protein RHSIM_Rhsim05G0116400 [Rhododendron simsii]